ncbi:glycosyl hydrolase family 71-domain-containing protein [Macrophomina phaseolina]|uniref:Glycosyl hydrolase family 71-domain-containing protein n=1 Tax=Macrophomina phaseolina TaxID=35725 RepID=A0ABQ8GMR4_9PEZI|nr:glycosyl hydrolase family 71-domain-containing protein [Macrophomina phaseolina]
MGPSIRSTFVMAASLFFLLLFSDYASAKAVFAHYMVGNAYLDHIYQDIDDAAAMGLDGFSLNIGDPRQSFVDKSLGIMFDYAAKNHPNFKLFVSMDLWAAGDADPKQFPIDFIPLLKKYISHDAYQRGPEPNSYPMVSTFADGGLENNLWQEWRDALDNNVFLIPDFDHTKGYYESHPGWWEYWGDIVDGLFSWESAWPERAGYGGEYSGDLSPDNVVFQGALNHSKPYMIPLSPLQYKNAYNTNIYRSGDINMLLRMEGILKMDPSPEYVQIITWNDGPESHYIGNLWREQNNDTDPSRYAMQANQPHDGWQPLIGSFIQAFKDEKKPSEMKPFDAVCPWDGSGQYFVKPDGFSNGVDALNFAAVVPGSGYSVELYRNGDHILQAELHSGLNYGTLPGLKAGYQKMVIKDALGATKRVATGGPCVLDGCPDCIYNMNLFVVPFSDNTDQSSGRCPETRCGGADIYVPQNIWTDQDPIMQCIPPCTFILPPLQLLTTTTISWPALTTTFWISTKSLTLIKTTIISIPPITTTEIPFWPVTIKVTDPPKGTIKPTQRIYPPGFTTQFPPTLQTFKPTRIDETNPPPTFLSTSHIEILQPQPTIQITHPPVPNITFTSAKPTATCTAQCGVNECQYFGCTSDEDEDGESDNDSDSGSEDDDPEDDDSSKKKRCGLFSCDWGCGIFGCFDGCGILGCGRSDHKCPLSKCGGLGCRTGTCEGIEGGGDDDEGTPDEGGDICEGDTCCNPELELDIGLCDNGNFPVYDMYTGTITCELTDEAEEQMSQCQKDALDDVDLNTDLLDAAQSCACLSGADGDLSRRSLPCPNQNPTQPPAVTTSAARCEATYLCDFNKSPQICANAKSAIDVRGKPDVMTIGHSFDPNNPDAIFQNTQDWYEGKFGIEKIAPHFMVVGNAAKSGSQAPVPRSGWALNGCDVEEYPFASGRDQNDIHPVVITTEIGQAAANGYAGPSPGDYFNQVKRAKRHAVCINIESVTNTCLQFTNVPSNLAANEYLLGDSKYTAYGIGYRLTNSPTRFVDPWFNRAANRKVDDGIGNMIPQFYENPSPGYRIFPSAVGKWVTAWPDPQNRARVFGVAYLTSNLAPAPACVNPAIIDNVWFEGLTLLPPANSSFSLTSLPPANPPLKRAVMIGAATPITTNTGGHQQKQPAFATRRLRNSIDAFIAAATPTAVPRQRARAALAVIPPGLLKRHIATAQKARRAETYNKTNVNATDLLSPLDRRSLPAAGGYLDPKVYRYLGCDLDSVVGRDDSFDPCYEGLTAGCDEISPYDPTVTGPTTTGRGATSSTTAKQPTWTSGSGIESGRVVVLVRRATGSIRVSSWEVINMSRDDYNVMVAREPWCEVEEEDDGTYNIALNIARSEENGLSGDYPTKLEFSLSGVDTCELTTVDGASESILSCPGLLSKDVTCETSPRLKDETTCNTLDRYIEKLICDY